MKKKEIFKLFLTYVGVATYNINLFLVLDDIDI